jgi:hypothetical protein
MKLRYSKCIFATLSLTVLVLGLALQATGQTLTHRYSFNDPPGSQTFADSVGGTNWVGTLVAGSGAP